MTARNLLRISDAATLAMHALALLSRADRPVRVATLAQPMRASRAHLSKVLQRLARAGLVASTRGPQGGFALERPGTEITLLEVLESIDGPLGEDGCLLAKPVCASPVQCRVRALNDRTRAMLIEELGSTTVDTIEIAARSPRRAQSSETPRDAADGGAGETHDDT